MYHLPSSRRVACILVTIALCAAPGCSEDHAGTSGIQCEADELYDQLNKECVPRPGGVGRDVESHPDAGTELGPDAQGSDANPADTAHPGDPDATTPDATDEETIDWAECDKDNDGALSEACGGYDCDDNDPSISPFALERCDNIDNNCNGMVNEYLDCTFYATSRTELFKVDPFAKTATLVHEAPGLQDIDTHWDGTLFGIKHDGIYHYDKWSDAWLKQGDYGMDIGDSNGLAIDQDGVAYITSDDKIYSADLRTGRATFVGSTGNFKSSGDCVVDKGNILYMTSKSPGQKDTLVRVSRDTGQGTAIGELGAIGFEKVYALTAAWGKLYGLTSGGELIEINTTTGVGKHIHTFEGMTFWGAASTPNR